MSTSTLRTVRVLGIVAGISACVIAVVLLLRLPFTQDIWPWTGAYSRLPALGYIFLASVFAAFGLPVIWLFVSRNYRAAAPIAVDVIVVMIGVSIFMFQSYLTRPNDRLLLGAVFAAVLIVVAVAIFVWAQRQPLHDTRPTPKLVRYSFMFFVIALLYVGGSLALKVPNIFPWTLTPEASVVYGWAFIGAATYFGYGILYPKWPLAAGQLLGFLIYDLVLIVPYLQHLAVVRDEQRLSLIIYLAVITYSMVLAGYFLLVNPSTRLWRATLPPTLAEAAAPEAP